METLEYAPSEYSSPDQVPDTGMEMAREIERELRIPYLLEGVVLAERHAFSPNASNPGGPTTFTGMKIDDGTGSSD